MWTRQVTQGMSVKTNVDGVPDSPRAQARGNMAVHNLAAATFHTALDSAAKCLDCGSRDAGRWRRHVRVLWVRDAENVMSDAIKTSFES